LIVGTTAGAVRCEDHTGNCRDLPACPLVDAARLIELIRTANDDRLKGNALPGASEALLDACFDCGSSLAVYGSLAPGNENHHLLRGLRSAWSEGYVEAVPADRGWGVSLGFAALVWKPGAPRHRVHLLRSPDLSATWARLDKFEGADYRRLLVPVWSGTNLLGVANLYSVATTDG
jgi:gamma-glutamylcyclotransferase (GGCT)/AIG2-like uncharacterized protein YtfP